MTTHKSFAALFAKVQETPSYQGQKLSVDFLADLNARMNAAHITNSELARRAGVSPAYITKLFRGSTNLTLDTVAKLADAVQCKAHLHLAENSATVRWFDVHTKLDQPAHKSHRAGAFEFMQMSQALVPVNNGSYDEQEHAFGAAA